MPAQFRNNDRCMNCGEMREIAAHGLCFACYRRNVREKERRDSHTPSAQERAHHKRLLKAYSTVMQGLLEIGVHQRDVLKMKSLLRPYLTAILHLIDEHIAGEAEDGNGKEHPVEIQRTDDDDSLKALAWAQAANGNRD
jgi:hypothetical protein